MMYKGKNGLARVLEKLKMPNFCKWRWGTMEDCAHEYQPVHEALGEHFDPSLFRKTRDQTMLNNVVDALGSIEFSSCLLFVCWLTKWLGSIMRWVGSCVCHQDEYKNGGKVECDMKGRLLTVCYQFAKKKLDEGLAESSLWTTGTFGTSRESLLNLKGCVRYSHSVALVKIDCFDRIPLACSRLLQPGMRDRLVKQWEESGKTDSTCARFFEPPLLNDVLALSPDGTGASLKLANEVRLVGHSPCDDTVGEGPHAIANAITARCHHGGWVWVASTMPLGQNLSTLPSMVGATDANLQELWSTWKNITKAEGTHQEVAKKCTRKQFLREVSTQAVRARL